MTPPTFSILVPTFNQAHFLSAALDSILAQTVDDWEAVVVNDGSTDDTARVLARYAAKDPRIRVFDQPNAGVAAALNQGLAQAHGTWINWLSSDDLFEPYRLERLLAAIADHPSVDFFYGYFRLLHEATNVLEERGLWGPVPPEGLEALGLLHRNFINGITICVRSETWAKVGRFDPRLRYGQDYGMWLRLLRVARPMLLPGATVISRHHDGQGSEVFPAACYFDSARAALEVLNATDLPTLVPFMDLTDPVQLERLMSTVMAVASDRTSFVYRLGCNALLGARMAEFLWSPSAPPAAEGLREHFLDKAGQLAVEHRDNDLGLAWSLLYSSGAAPRGGNARMSLDPVEMAIGTYVRARAAVAPEADALGAYIENLMGETLPAVNGGHGACRVLLLGAAGDAEIEDCAHALFPHGVISLRPGDSLGQDRLGYIFPHPHIDPAVALLGCHDVAASKFEKELAHSCASQRVLLNGEPDKWIQRILNRLPRGKPAAPCDGRERQRVLLLGLSPWGGGAERVLAELCSGLDRERFDVQVAFLYPGSDLSHYPRDCQMQVLSDGRVVSHDAARESAASVRTPAPSGLMQRVVQRLPPWLYESLCRIGVRKLVRAAYWGLRHARRLQAHPLMTAVKIGRLARALASVGVAAVRYRLLTLASRLPVGTRVHMHLWELRYAAVLERLRHLLTQYDEAIVITFMEHATILTEMAMPEERPQLLVSLHTCESAYLPIIFESPTERRFVERMLRKAVANSAGAFLPSAGCAEDLIRYLGVPAPQIGVLNNPVNIARIRLLAAAPPPGDVLEWVGGRRLYISVGRLEQEKNHALLIETMMRLGDSAGVAVVVIGDGSLRADLEREVEVRDLGDRLRFLGAMSNPFRLLKSAHALVLTSHFESFGLVLVEAMALGVPAIAVDCPFGPREILGEGRFGALVPCNDADGLAETMRRLAQDDEWHLELRNAGFGRAMDFDVSRILTSWERAIEACNGNA